MASSNDGRLISHGRIAEPPSITSNSPRDTAEKPVTHGNGNENKKKNKTSVNI
jgi:hypothetical protein